MFNYISLIFAWLWNLQNAYNIVVPPPMSYIGIFLVACLLTLYSATSCRV